MGGIPVELVDQGVDWPAWVQAVGSVLAILVSVGLGVWLQDRERTKKKAGDLANQIAALTAIADRCVKTLEGFDERSRLGTFTKANIGRLNDEAIAMEVTVSAVDLMNLRSAELIHIVAELQEAGRTGRRRVKYAGEALQRKQSRPPDDFKDPLERAKAALVGLFDIANRNDLA